MIRPCDYHYQHRKARTEPFENLSVIMNYQSTGEMMTKKNQSTGGHTDNGLKIRCWNIQHRRCSTLGQKTSS